MLAGERADVEQTALDCFQPRRVERHRLGRALDALLGLARLDHCPIECGQRLAQQRVLGRTPLDPARRAAQLRQGPVRAAEQLVETGERLPCPRSRLHRRSIFGQCRLFARFGGEPGDLVNGEGQPLAVPFRILDRASRIGEPSLERIERGPCGGDACRHDPPKTVEQCPVPPRVEQPAVVMLAVDLDRERADLAQGRGGHAHAPDERAAAAVRLHRPAQCERLPGLHLDALLGKQRKRGVARGKHQLGRDRRAVLPGTDQAAVRACAQRQAQCVEQDRLARTGLSGQHPQPPLEVELEPVDQHHVTDGELAQHRGRPAPVRSAAGCAG